MNGNRAIQPRKKFILNDYRQPLPASAEPLPGGKYPAQLMWEQKNNGDIVMKVQDGVYKEGGKNTHKEVVMDNGDRNFLFEALLEAANNPEFTFRKVTPRRRQFIQGPGGGKMSDQPVVQVNLMVTREDTGRITLGYSKGDYKVVFHFNGPRDMVVMKKGPDGQAVEDHEIMARWHVRSYVNWHRPILDQMERDGWEPPKPRDGGASNNNNRNGGGSSYNNDSDEGGGFDDEF